MPAERPTDDSRTDDGQPTSGRRLIALGKPPFDDPDPRAMDGFVEAMVAEIRDSDPALAPDEDADEAGDGTPDGPASV